MKLNSSKKSNQKKELLTSRIMPQKLESSIVSDVQAIQKEIDYLQVRLSDYVSEDNLNEIYLYAFELARQEAEYYKLPRNKEIILYNIRRHMVLTEAYGCLYSKNKKMKNVTELRINLDFGQIPLVFRRLHNQIDL